MIRLTILPRAASAGALAFTLLLATPAWAHGDEDHGAAATPPAASTQTASADLGAPRRLPDGSLWVPKAAQHRLGILTQAAQLQDHAVTVALNGRVLPDPNAGGRVQATQAGRIEPGPRGLPALGQAVSKGQVLAYLRPAANSIDQANQQAALADLDAQYAVAERKAARYEQLDGVVPQKDIEAARFERDALKKRRAAVGASVSAPQALVAPVSGTLAASNVVLGQVVDAKDVLFEIIDPARLVVEALAYDAAQAQGLGRASATVPGGELQLQFAGGARQLREQALPVLFRVTRATAPVAVGQTLQVIAQTSRTLPGVALPLGALGKNAAGDAVVWLHVAPEQFAPRVVRIAPLDAGTVVVTTGLKAGDRVVTQGASLLAQVR
jgi:hypothetical protein